MLEGESINVKWKNTFSNTLVKIIRMYLMILFSHF